MQKADNMIHPNIFPQEVKSSNQMQGELESVFSYNNNNVRMHKENGVVYVCVTDIARVFPRKNLTTIINSKEIQDYLEVLSKLKNISLADLLQVKRGGDGSQGTWAHQKVALRVAQKLSPDFAVWVDTKIEELLTCGITSVVPKSTAQMFAMQAQVNLEFENRVAVLENKFANMEKEREENTKKLLMLPLSDNKLPEQSMKSKIRELVNAYANAKGVTQQDTWHRVYKDLYYLHGISINSYKKTSKRETKLSIAERNGFLGKVFDIISNLVKEVN